MTKSMQHPKSVESSSKLKTGYRLALLFVLLLALLLGGLVIFAGSLDAPTIALALVGGVLVLVVYRFYTMMMTFAGRDAAWNGLPGENALSSADELQRTLRGIKELEFDHQLGKISEADFRLLHSKYAHRAVELMRHTQPSTNEQQSQVGLHPKVEQLVASISTKETRRCWQCDGSNDEDARFCKHCGKGLAA